MTKVFIDSDYDLHGYVLVDPAVADHWTIQRKLLYNVPKRLIRRHKQVLEDLERINRQLWEITEEQDGEVSKLRETQIWPPRVVPQVSLYQLRHVKTRIVYTELTVPAGQPLSWEPQPGAEPDGVCQWYQKHMEDADFWPLGGPLRYDSKKAK